MGRPAKARSSSDVNGTEPLSASRPGYDWGPYGFHSDGYQPRWVSRDVALRSSSSPASERPPCLTSSTESATSPAATRGASSPPGSSSPARSSCSTRRRAASTDESFSLPGLGVAARRRRHRGALPAGDALLLQRHLPLRGRPDRPGHQGRDRAGRRRSSPTGRTWSP